MKKAYTFRLEPTLIKQLDKFNGTRTYNVDLAIQTYVQNDCNLQYNSNTETIQLFKNQIMDLKEDKDRLQKRLDYYMLPWYKKPFVKLLPAPKQ